MRKRIFWLLFSKVEREAVKHGMMAGLTVNTYGFDDGYAAKYLLQELFGIRRNVSCARRSRP